MTRTVPVRPADAKAAENLSRAERLLSDNVPWRQAVGERAVLVDQWKEGSLVYSAHTCSSADATGLLVVSLVDVQSEHVLAVRKVEQDLSHGAIVRGLYEDQNAKDIILRRKQFHFR
jgi:hypothetical protein